jgi:C-terminal processing protease CtpA/Prc
MSRHPLSRNLGLAMLLGAGLALAPSVAQAQASEIVQILDDSNPLLGHSSGSQGYLGVDVTDVDNEKAQTLKLKEVRGAVITLIDHDAPAGQIGLKVNDVVLQLNGQNVEGAEQLRRLLREVPAGRKVSIEISRDGSIQTLAVELADRRVMEHDVWNKIGNGDVFPQDNASGMGILSGSGDAPLPGGFHMPFFGSTLNVGAMVEPLTSQMAEYLGVTSGLMVKQVAHKSEAAAAGLKAFDVILKVDSDAVTTLADWDRALRANQGKPVQVTILRDKKQQTLTLQVDSKHKGELEDLEIFSAGDGPVVAELNLDLAPDLALAQQLTSNNQAAAQALRDQAEAMREKMRGMQQLMISPQQAEEIRKQAEALRDSIKAQNLQNFKIDQGQLDQMKQQMDEFRKSFKPEDFKIDSKQMEEFRQQMDQFKRQMEELKVSPAPNFN